MKKVIAVVTLLAVAAFFGAGTASAQKPMELGVNVGTVMPFGDLGDVVKLGFGGGVTFNYFYKENIAIKGLAGYHMFAKKKTTTSVVVPFVGTISTTIETKGSFIPVAVGADYYLAAKGKMKPYVGALVGYYAGSDNLDSGIGFAPEVGMTYPMGTMKLDINAVYNYVALDKAANYIGINVGLLFDLSKK